MGLLPLIMLIKAPFVVTAGIVVASVFTGELSTDFTIETSLPLGLDPVSMNLEGVANDSLNEEDVIKPEGTYGPETFNSYINSYTDTSKGWGQQKAIMQNVDSHLNGWLNETMNVTVDQAENFEFELDHLRAIIDINSHLMSVVGHQWASEFVESVNGNPAYEVINVPVNSALGEITPDDEAEIYTPGLVVNPFINVVLPYSPGEGTFVVAHSIKDPSKLWLIALLHHSRGSDDSNCMDAQILCELVGQDIDSFIIRAMCVSDSDNNMVIFDEELRHHVANLEQDFILGQTLSGNSVHIDVLNAPYGFSRLTNVREQLNYIFETLNLANFNEAMNGKLFDLDFVGFFNFYIKALKMLGVDVNGIPASLMLKFLAQDSFFQSYCINIGLHPGVVIGNYLRALEHIEEAMRISEYGGTNSVELLLDLVRFNHLCFGHGREIANFFEQNNNEAGFQFLNFLAWERNREINGFEEAREVRYFYNVSNRRNFYELVSYYFRDGESFTLEEMQAFETGRVINIFNNYYFNGDGRVSVDAIDVLYSHYLRNMLNITFNHTDNYLTSEGEYIPALDNNFRVEYAENRARYTLDNAINRGELPFSLLRRFEVEVGPHILGTQGMDSTNVLPGYRRRAIISAVLGVEQMVTTGTNSSFRVMMPNSFDRLTLFEFLNVSFRNLLERGVLSADLESYREAWIPLLTETLPLPTNFLVSDNRFSYDRTFNIANYEMRIDQYDVTSLVASRVYIPANILENFTLEYRNRVLFDEELMALYSNNDIQAYRVRRDDLLRETEVQMLDEMLAYFLQNGEEYINLSDFDVVIRLREGNDVWRRLVRDFIDVPVHEAHQQLASMRESNNTFNRVELEHEHTIRITNAIVDANVTYERELMEAPTEVSNFTQPDRRQYGMVEGYSRALVADIYLLTRY